MLRDVPLRIEYNENDDVLQDFFTPCFSVCTTFDRCVDYFALSNLISMVDRFKLFAAGFIRIRLVVGHKFHIRDINTLTRMFSGDYRGKGHSGKVLERIMDLILTDHVMIRIAVPTAEKSSAVFRERLGIFGDEKKDKVAFSGPLIYSPITPGIFETVDVFTSWNDPERVQLKQNCFEALWNDKVKSVKTYDFIDADQQGLLKYSAEWITDY